MSTRTRANGIDENGNITYGSYERHYSDESNKAQATNAAAELEWAQKLYELRYNSPEEVKKRLVAAGYNPNLYNNEGNTFGSSVSTEPLQAQPIGDQVLGMLNQGLDGLYKFGNLASQRDLALKEQDLKRSSLDLEREKVDQAREDLARRNRDTESQILRRAQENKESEERIGVYRSQVRQIDSNWQKILQETENLRAQNYNIKQQGRILESDANWRDAIHSAEVEKMYNLMDLNNDQRKVLQQKFIQFCLDNGEHQLILGADSFEGPDGQTYSKKTATPVIMLEKQGNYLDVQIKNSDTSESRQWTETILNGIGKMVGAVAAGAAAGWTMTKISAAKAAGAVAPIVTPPGTDILMNQSSPWDPTTSNPNIY